MHVSRLAVDLPATEIDFLNRYAKRHKTTVSNLVDRWIKSLKPKPTIHPDIKKLTGILPGEIDFDKAITNYIMEKHK